MPANSQSEASPAAPGVFLFDEFELDIPGFELRRAGSPVPMEPQVFEVLAFLVDNAGRVLTKDEILDHVWPERYVSEASLNSRVMSARKALGDSGSEQRYIKTVHGRGYRFVGALTADGAGEPEMVAAPASPVAAPAPPAPRSTFFGREGEIARIGSLFAQPACRVLTIAGPGGIGKTSLALEAMRVFQATAEPPASTIFVPMEHVEAHHFELSLATGLGIQPGGDVRAQLVHLLRRNPPLVVLDNVEHLVEAARPVLEAILAAAPEARFLITSRVPLGMPLEWLLRMEGLATEEDEGGSPAAARLFLDRAGRANACTVEFDAAEVAAICRTVEGMPLAIELAASLTRYLPLPRILELIQKDAASALATTLHGLPERHRSVRGLFDASLAQLDGADRATLAKLAVFEGSFESAAAEAVTGVSVATLVAFMDSSLLQTCAGRFSMHPLLRQYLGPTDTVAPEAGQAHAEYYTAFMEVRARALHGRGQVAAMDEIEPEATNVMAAWRWAVQHRRTDLIERARTGTFTFLVFRGRFLEADELAEAALSVMDAAEEPESVSGLLVHHAWVLMRIGQTARGAASVARAIALCREHELPWKRGFGSDPRLAVAAFRVGAGDYAGALVQGREALRLAEAARDEPGIAFAAWMTAVSLNRLADVVLLPGNSDGRTFVPAPGDTCADEAEVLLNRAVRILEAQDEVWLRAFVEIERGLNINTPGGREASYAHFRTAYNLRRKLNDPQGMTSALMYLADALIDDGQVEEALSLHDEMRLLLPRTADATGWAELARSSGIAAAAQGDYALARERLAEALESSRAIEFANNVTGSLRSLGAVFLRDGEEALGLEIMHAVAAHPSTTPGSRARARVILESYGREWPPLDPDAAPLDALANRAARAAVSFDRWLQPALERRPFAAA